MADSGEKPSLEQDNNSSWNTLICSDNNKREAKDVELHIDDEGDQTKRRKLDRDICDICKVPALHPWDTVEREKHIRDCAAKRAAENEKECGICLSAIKSRPEATAANENSEDILRFGILENCNHSFCLNCIRTWRSKADDSVIKNYKSCPYCRTSSNFILPSSTWIESKKIKKEMFKQRKEVLRKYKALHMTLDYIFIDECTDTECPIHKKRIRIHQNLHKKYSKEHDVVTFTHEHWYSVIDELNETAIDLDNVIVGIPMLDMLMTLKLQYQRLQCVIRDAKAKK